uniref:Structure-specific endonuclease subunit SLX4 n=1 Tax=Anopheles minimus TaxID=112268 RepID=A0A182WIM4_9DIPT
MSKRLKYAKLRLTNQIDAVDPPSLEVPAELVNKVHQTLELNCSSLYFLLLHSSTDNNTVINKTSKYFEKGLEKSCTNEDTFIQVHSEDSGEDNATAKRQSSRRRPQKPPEACPNVGLNFPKLRKKSSEGNGLISNFLSAQTKQKAEEDDDFEETKSGTGSQPKQTKVQKVTKKITKDRKRSKNQSDIRKVFKKYKNEHAVLHEFLKEHGAAEQIDPEQLQIALAMSRSLADQECDQDQTQSGEPLAKDCSTASCSGSSEERRIVSIRTTLEQFGFRCKNSYTDYDLNIIFRSESTKNVKKIKHKRATNLQRRSKQELDAFIDRQAEELIRLRTIENAKLKDLENISSRLSNHFWIAQTELCSDQLMDEYYVPELFKASPAPVGCMLKDWSKIPGRQSTPDRDKQAPKGEMYARMDSPDMFNDSEITNNTHEYDPNEGSLSKEVAARNTEQECGTEHEQQVHSPEVLVIESVVNGGKCNAAAEDTTYSNIGRNVEKQKTTSRETDQLSTADKSIKMQAEIIVLDDNCEESQDNYVTVSDVSQRPQPAFHHSSENIFEDTDPNPMVSFEVYSSEEEKISAASRVLVGMTASNGDVGSTKMEQEDDRQKVILEQNNCDDLQNGERDHIARKTVEEGKDSYVMEVRFSSEKDHSFHRLALKARLSEALEGMADTVATVDLLECISDSDKSIMNLVELNETLSSEVSVEENHSICCEHLQVPAKGGIESVEEKKVNTTNEDPDLTIQVHVDETIGHTGTNIGANQTKCRDAVQEEESEIINSFSINNASEAVVAETNCAESTFAYLGQLVKEFNLPPLKSQQNEHKGKANQHTSTETDVTDGRVLAIRQTEFCQDVSVIRNHVYEVSDELSNYLHNYEEPHFDDSEIAAEKNMPTSPLLDCILGDKTKTTSSKVISKIKSCTQFDSPRAYSALRRTASEIRFPSSSTPDDKSGPSRFDDKFIHLKTVALDMPQTEYIINTSNVNQQPPAYEDMSTPEIERELFKYGLKAMQRSKAIRVLHFLFDEMHPSVMLVEKHSTQMDMKDSCSKANDTKDHPTSVPYTSAVFKTPRRCAFKLDDKKSETLQRQILRYEPINLEKIYELLKDAGLRYDTNDLIAFLDKHCITFRTASSTGDRMAKVKSMDAMNFGLTPVNGN